MITIVGAGPAGSYLAYLLAKKGKDVTEFKWLDANKLPKDVAPNIKPVLRYFKFIS